MSEIKWIDKRSNKRKVVTLDVLDSKGEAVGEVQALFDPNDQATLAGAVMEIRGGLTDEYKLKRIDTTFGETRRKYVQKLVYLKGGGAC